MELTFRHRGHDYCLRRNPEYTRASKRGDGVIVRKHAAELQSDTGESWSGLDEIAQRVQELIGLTRDQFAQTVMIAQGDFLKILNAKSAERRDLFQRLFGTFQYAQLQLRLKEKSAAAQQARGTLEKRLQIAASRVNVDADYADGAPFALYLSEPRYADRLLAAMDGLLAFENEKRANVASRLEAADRRLADASAALADAKHTNEDFALLDRCRAALDRLIEAQSAIDDDAARLARARRALRIAPAARTRRGCSPPKKRWPKPNGSARRFAKRCPRWKPPTRTRSARCRKRRNRTGWPCSFGNACRFFLSWKPAPRRKPGSRPSSCSRWTRAAARTKPIPA